MSSFPEVATLMLWPVSILISSCAGRSKGSDIDINNVPSESSCIGTRCKRSAVALGINSTASGWG